MQIPNPRTRKPVAGQHRPATEDGISPKGNEVRHIDRHFVSLDFFVNDYPVIVFAQQASSDAAHWMRVFNSVWCMARPQMLFLARDGELSVLNLTKKPAREAETLIQFDRLLATAKATADVQEKLHSYRRDQVESGRLFEDERFGFDDRADRALVRDLTRSRIPKPLNTRSLKLFTLLNASVSVRRLGSGSSTKTTRSMECCGSGT